LAAAMSWKIRVLFFWQDENAAFSIVILSVWIYRWRYFALKLIVFLCLDSALSKKKQISRGLFLVYFVFVLVS
jgi:hypothetical protein